MKIIRSGMLDTIQDHGRFGYGMMGINHNGAMDEVALSIANILAGNPANSPAVELHFPCGEYYFDETTLISISGADFTPVVNGQPISLNRPIVVPAESRLSFARRKNGMRCYLAVHGGIVTNQWLGSGSTNLKAKAGGFEGRALKQGDVLQFNAARLPLSELTSRSFTWSVQVKQFYNVDSVMHMIPGNEWELLTDEEQNRILGQRFIVKSSSDRMALQLDHDIVSPIAKELLSSAVTTGTIQLLPSGKFLVLMSDHQTTGGYPRIGHIISAHLPSVAQLAPGDGFRLQCTTVREAEKLLFSIRREMQRIEESVRQKFVQYGNR